MMHKYSQMVYDILKGYTEGVTVRTIMLNGWDMSREMGIGRDGKPMVQHPKTKFHVTFILFRFNVLDNSYFSSHTLEFPEVIDVKYFYRALHELQKTHGVSNPIKEEEVYRSLGLAKPLTAWDVLVKDTDFEAPAVE